MIAAAPLSPTARSTAAVSVKVALQPLDGAGLLLAQEQAQSPPSSDRSKTNRTLARCTRPATTQAPMHPAAPVTRMGAAVLNGENSDWVRPPRVLRKR